MKAKIITGITKKLKKIKAKVKDTAKEKNTKPWKNM